MIILRENAESREEGKKDRRARRASTSYFRQERKKDLRNAVVAKRGERKKSKVGVNKTCKKKLPP